MNNATAESIFTEVQRNLFIVLAIVGGVVAASGTIIAIVTCCLGKGALLVPAEGQETDNIVDDDTPKEHSAGVICFFILVGACVQLVGDGQKLSLAESYLKTFLVHHMQLTKLEGVIAVTTFTGSHVLWAIFGRFIQKKFGVSVPLFIMVVFNIAGAAVLMVCGHSFVLFCVGCALIGLGLSAKSACLVCWVRYVIGDNDFIIYTSYLSWAVGDITFANLIGRLVKDTPYSFVYVIFGGSVAMVVAVIVAHIGYIAVFKKEHQTLSACLRPLFVKDKISVT
jgi:hypothetical protein